MSGSVLKQAWENAAKPPEGWQGDLYFHNRQDQRIRYGYAPAQGEKIGTIVLTHGYSESIDQYYETIKKYQQRGYEVWGMDFQGHGLSERDDPVHPLQPSARGMLRHVRDLDFFVNNVVKTYHDDTKPLIMSTHSMGGHIGLLYLRQYPGVFDGAVMSAPMFDIYRFGAGKWARPFIRGFFNAASALGFRDAHTPNLDDITGFLPKAFRKAADFVVEAFKKPQTLRNVFREKVIDMYPEARLGRPTFGWIANAFKTILPSMEEDFLKEIDTPLLIGSAENEDLVANDAHRRAAELMPNAENVLIKGSSHGIWFAENGPFEEWWSHIDKFLKEKVKVNNPAAPEDATEKRIAAGENLGINMRGNVVRMMRCTNEHCDIDFPNKPS